MFVCLFKKVTIQKNNELSTINCNHSTNTLAIGGDDGFLKVVQIDLVKTRKNPDGSAASPVTFSQTLTCHRKKISNLIRNDKLTACDEEGVIVVWRFENERDWKTEMINNRKIDMQ